HRGEAIQQTFVVLIVVLAERKDAQAIEKAGGMKRIADLEVVAGVADLRNESALRAELIAEVLPLVKRIDGARGVLPPNVIRMCAERLPAPFSRQLGAIRRVRIAD